MTRYRPVRILLVLLATYGVGILGWDLLFEPHPERGIPGRSSRRRGPPGLPRRPKQPQHTKTRPMLTRCAGL